jgi:hypothetical protein
LALLSDCGLRSQEAADVQLRDLDLGAAMLTARSGKGRKARRVQFTQELIRTLTAYLKVRCSADLPPIGSEVEREPLLMKRNVTKAGAPWEPGLTTIAMRKHLGELRQQAVTLIQKRAATEPSLERIAELEALARQVAVISPHKLRHGLAYRLWKTALLGHGHRLPHRSIPTSTRQGPAVAGDRRGRLAHPLPAATVTIAGHTSDAARRCRRMPTGVPGPLVGRCPAPALAGTLGCDPRRVRNTKGSREPPATRRSEQRAGECLGVDVQSHRYGAICSCKLCQ